MSGRNGRCIEAARAVLSRLLPPDDPIPSLISGERETSTAAHVGQHVCVSGGACLCVQCWLDVASEVRPALVGVRLSLHTRRQAHLPERVGFNATVVEAFDRAGPR